MNIPQARTWLPVVAGLLAVFTSWTASAEPAPLPDAVRQFLAGTTAGRYGLAIGIDEFDDDRFPDLRWAEDDARAVSQALIGEGGFDSSATVTAPDATRAGVLEQLDAFLDPLGPDDTALVYISSHGTVGYPDGGARRFIVTSDTDGDALAATAVEVSEVLDRVDRALPRWKVVILATCFGGSGEGVRYIESPEFQGRRGATRFTDAGPRRATVVLSASYSGGPAWEDADLGHEVYTYYLLEALGRPGEDQVDLNGDGALSAFEAHGYASARTVAHSAGRQFPSANLEAVGELDVILMGQASRSAQRAMFWPAGQPRGAADEDLWLDGERVPPGSPVQALEPGRHLLEIGTDERRERTRRMAFRVRRGQAVRVQDLVARSQDQWIGGGIGVWFPIEDSSGFGASYGAINLIFEQRLWARRPTGGALALSLSWGPGPTYDGPLSAPARMAALELAPMLERRGPVLALGGGPVIGGLYVRRERDLESSIAALYAGGKLRVRIRLVTRTSLRLEAQLAGTRTANLYGLPQFVLLPSLSAGVGVEW